MHTDSDNSISATTDLLTVNAVPFSLFACHSGLDMAFLDLVPGAVVAKPFSTEKFLFS